MPNTSLSVIRRLPRYHRHLSDLRDGGVSRISSGELAAHMEVTASQVRQDFSCLGGGLGQQGLGYSVPLLLERIGGLLGLEDGRTAVLLGVGNIGRALLSNFRFEARGFTLVGAFDVDDVVVGTVINGYEIKHIDTLATFCAGNAPDIAILSVPGIHANAIARQCSVLGIRGFWNFANVEIKLPGVTVENVHFSDSLMTLCYMMTM